MLLNALVFIVALLAAPLAWAAQGYVHEVSGKVTAAVGAGQPLNVARGQHLVNNTTLVTAPQSYAVLKFEDGTVVVLKENSSFQVLDYRYNTRAPADSNAAFSMLRGGLRMITGVISTRNRDAVKVGTPLATIRIRGTEFLAELVNPLLVQTISGAVTLTNSAGTVVVAAGQIGTVTTSTTLGTVGAVGTVPGPNVPNVSVPPATPGPIPSGSTAGLTDAAGGGGGAAAVAGAAAAAGIAAASEGTTASAHHH